MASLPEDTLAYVATLVSLGACIFRKDTCFIFCSIIVLKSREKYRFLR